MTHEFASEWKAVIQKEMVGVEARGTYKEVSDTLNIAKIPLKWVFSYKFNTNGFLTKFKARLYV